MPQKDPPVPLVRKTREFLFGKPRDLKDRSLFHKLSLVPFLAWVGLGADGLSSSSYGPMESYGALQGHSYLAVGLAAMTALTVAVVATAYSRIIQHFPHGGGGYVVATKLLGRPFGVVSGSALLVDYVMTITVSIAAAGDALFSFLPVEWQAVKLPVEALVILVMTAMNIRGVREAVMPLVPVFLLFVVTHVALIGGGLWEHVTDIPKTVHDVGSGFREGYEALGLAGMLGLFARAWSMGGGTYTGIEAVSNGMPILREPKVHTGRRTMLYMAISLALTAGGLLVCYLLVGVTFEEGKTLNAVLSEAVFADWPGGRGIAIATLVSEGALLIVGAQAGFIDGPRVLANMSHDGWVPRRFGALSDRLTSQNGIVLMGAASLGALVYTNGNVSALVVMYSINVFLTFSLSMAGMFRMSIGSRDPEKRGKRWAALFAFAFLLCATILIVTSYEKFAEGGWLTLVVTSGFAGLCFLVRRHYAGVGGLIAKLDHDMSDLEPHASHKVGKLDISKPTAVILVGGYGGLGIATLLGVLRQFRGHFKGVVFVSAGIVDSGAFKGQEEMEALRASVEATVHRYVDLARNLGLPAAFRYSVGTDAVEELERLCVAASKTFTDATFFAGKLVFRAEHWYHRWLHNETAIAVQKRLQVHGLTMVVLPKLVD